MFILNTYLPHSIFLNIFAEYSFTELFFPLGLVGYLILAYQAVSLQ